MKHLNDYKIFEKQIPKGKEDIHTLCRNHGIRDYTINEDGSIDVNSSVYLDGRKLTKLPLKFNRVNGGFFCRDNKLTSLEGCPKYVGGDFCCQYNSITSLEGCPEHVGDGFYCSRNPIYDLVKYFIYREDKNNLIELFNYYDIIQGKNVIYDRLKFFYDGIDVEVTDKMLIEIERKGYKIIR